MKIETKSVSDALQRAIGAQPGAVEKALQGIGDAVKLAASSGRGHTNNSLTSGVQMVVAVMEQAINDEIGRLSFDKSQPKLLSEKFSVERATRSGTRPWLTNAKLDPPLMLFRQPPSAAGNVVALEASLTFTSGELGYLSNFIGDKITLPLEDLALTTSIVLTQSRASLKETLAAPGTTAAAKAALSRLQKTLDVLTLVAEIPVDSITKAKLAPGDYAGAEANVLKRWKKQVGIKTGAEFKTLLAEVQAELGLALAAFFASEKANKNYPLLHCGYTPALPQPNTDASLIPYEVKESLDLNPSDPRLSSLVYAMSGKKGGIPKTYLSAWTDAWVKKQELTGEAEGQKPAGVLLIDDELLLSEWVRPQIAQLLEKSLGWNFAIGSDGVIVGTKSGPKKSSKGFDQKLGQRITATVSKVPSRPGYDVNIEAKMAYQLVGIAQVDAGFPPTVDIVPKSTKHGGHFGHLESDEFNVGGKGSSGKTLKYRLDVDSKSDNGLALTLIEQTKATTPSVSAGANVDLSDVGKVVKKLLPAIFDAYEGAAKDQMKSFLSNALRDLVDVDVASLQMTAPFIFPTGATFTFREVVVTSSGDILVHPYYRSR